VLARGSNGSVGHVTIWQRYTAVSASLHLTHQVRGTSKECGYARDVMERLCKKFRLNVTIPEEQPSANRRGDRPAASAVLAAARDLGDVHRRL